MPADTTPPLLEMFRFPRLRAAQVLEVLAQVAEAHGDLDAAGLRLGQTEPGWYVLYLPARRDRDRSGAGARLHQDLVGAVQAVAGAATIGRGSQQAAPHATEGLFAPGAGAVVITAEAAERATAPETPPAELLVVASRTGDTGAITSVIRKGRDARIMTGEAGRVAILVENSAESYGTVSDMLGRGDLPPDLVALRPWSAGRGTLWLPLDLGTPAPGTLQALGRIREAMGDRPPGAPPPDVACLRAPNGVGFEIHVLPAPAEAARVADALAPDQEPLQVFDIRTLTYVDAPEAARALSQEILRHADRIGYRIRLHPVPPGVGRGMDVEPLLEQIEDLRLRIAQVKALGAPQQRLLRFSDAQLPAMVDALRSLPPEALRDGSLLYAAGHSEGRAEPAHFLLYDATALHLRFPQSLWQSRTESRPMSYWLEPFVAEAQLAAPTNTRVFVPDRHMLSPSLAHFGGDVDGTLKLVLGSLFVSLGDLASDPDRQPYFVFSPRTDDPAILEVEVVDGALFAPVQQQIGWMNDYLQVRGPNVVAPETLQAVAEELYEGAFVEEVRKGVCDQVAAATRDWDAALDRVRADAAALLDAHVDELEGVTRRIAQAHAYLRGAEAELAGLEELMQIAAGALQGRAEVEAVLQGKDKTIRAAAETFSEAMDHELARGTDRIAAAERRLATLHARFEELSRWRR
ncbi:hypothetical protein [Mesobacterium pallidum]|uniref:hypothetical protein n=1 Tax=Mesobacterium pallidum TaxID=2872037 RepID=UPI001EE21904|nr:hypothetical protein [Mesobacterium pallidum]